MLLEDSGQGLDRLSRTAVMAPKHTPHLSYSVSLTFPPGELWLICPVLELEQAFDLVIIKRMGQMQLCVVPEQGCKRQLLMPRSWNTELSCRGSSLTALRPPCCEEAQPVHKESAHGET